MARSLFVGVGFDYFKTHISHFSSNVSVFFVLLFFDDMAKIKKVMRAKLLLIIINK